MTKSFKEFSTNALLNVGDETILKGYSTSKAIGLYTFIWATKSPVEVVVDGVPLTLKPNQILSLTAIQYFQFIQGEAVIVYQFNREFYCIKDHDKEIGCIGLLFFGNDQIPIMSVNEGEQRKFRALHEVFLEELETTDTIQAEMLRMLMARFIIKTTRLLKTETRDKPN